MAELERIYTIPLRKQVQKSPEYKRAKKAMNTVKAFLSKHMKSDDIKIGQIINRELWKRGIKNPPHKIKVTAAKDDKGIVRAELFGHKYVEKKKIEKVEKSKLEQLKEKMLGKTEEQKEEKKEDINKEAITHIPEHEINKQAALKEKEIGAAREKERKAAKGKEKAEIRDKR